MYVNLRNIKLKNKSFWALGHKRDTSPGHHWRESPLCDQSKSQRQLKSQTDREEKHDDDKAMRRDGDRERDVET